MASVCKKRCFPWELCPVQKNKRLKQNNDQLSIIIDYLQQLEKQIQELQREISQIKCTIYSNCNYIS